MRVAGRPTFSIVALLIKNGPINVFCKACLGVNEIPIGLSFSW